MRPPCARQGCSPEKHTPVLQRRPAWPDLGGARVFPLMALLTNFFKDTLTGGQMIYNIVLVSGVQQSASVIRTHTPTLSQTLPMQAVTEHRAMQQVFSLSASFLTEETDLVLRSVQAAVKTGNQRASPPHYGKGSHLQPRRLTIFQMVCMQFQSKFPFFPQVSKTDYTICYFTFPQ